MVDEYRFLFAVFGVWLMFLILGFERPSPLAYVFCRDSQGNRSYIHQSFASSPVIRYDVSSFVYGPEHQINALPSVDSSLSYGGPCDCIRCIHIFLPVLYLYPCLFLYLFVRLSIKPLLQPVAVARYFIVLHSQSQFMKFNGTDNSLCTIELNAASF